MLSYYTSVLLYEYPPVRHPEHPSVRHPERSEGSPKMTFLVCANKVGQRDCS